ncbi:MAG: hypothetical protein GY790_15220 [Bacteroidetes bacterium]|nr:hypothetical protein [Bacteroidota bacterium]
MTRFTSTTFLLKRNNLEVFRIFLFHISTGTLSTSCSKRKEPKGQLSKEE